MSLISQNAQVKKRGKKAKEETNEPLPLDGNVEIDVTEESNLVIVNLKRRKKELSEEEKQMEVEEEKTMKRLESFMFPNLYSPIQFGKEEAEEASDEVGGGPPLFFTDKSGDMALAVYEDDVEYHGKGNGELDTTDKKPAWVDEEEEKKNIDIVKVNRLRKLRKVENENLIRGSDYVARLRAQHVKLNPGTEWAQLGSQFKKDESDEENGDFVDRDDDDDDIDGNDSLLQSNEELVMKGGVKLLPGLLEYSRLVDANAEEQSSGPINSVQFHRNGQLLLTGGLDKRLRFFQIDGKRNTKIQSIFLENCPIRKASFLPDGSHVIVGGRRKYFYSFDLEKVRVDKIGPLTGREEKSLETFKVSPDSNTIAFVGNEGYILLVSKTIPAVWISVLVEVLSPWEMPLERYYYTSCIITSMLKVVLRGIFSCVNFLSGYSSSILIHSYSFKVEDFRIFHLPMCVSLYFFDMKVNVVTL